MFKLRRYIIPPYSFCEMLANFRRVEFVRTTSKFRKKKTENRRHLFKFSIKSVIRKFNVGVKAVAANINVLYYELHVPSYYISL